MSRYIDAEYNLRDLYCYFDFSDEELTAISTVLKLIPTADVVERKQGKNISEDGFLCSVCTFGDFGGFHGYEPNYCPNCGAKMYERREDAEAVNKKN